MISQEQLLVRIKKLETAVMHLQQQISRQNSLEDRLGDVENWLRSQFTSFKDRRLTLKTTHSERSSLHSHYNVLDPLSSRNSVAAESAILGLSTNLDDHEQNESASDLDDHHHGISEAESNDDHFEDFRSISANNAALSEVKAEKFRNEKVEYWLGRKSPEKVIDVKVNKKRLSPNVGRENDPNKKVIAKKLKLEPGDPGYKKPQVRKSTGKCRFGCQKIALKTCEICHKYVCADHRYKTVRCPDYLPALKDCYSSESQVKKCPISKEGIGRCVCCPGGKQRKTSRTQCQTCGRYICADHQRKNIRCTEHRHDTMPKVVDFRERSPIPLQEDLNNYDNDTIDHIVML